MSYPGGRGERQSRPARAGVRELDDLGAGIRQRVTAGATENVDSSSGAIGAAVNNAIAQLVPIIIDGPADARTRKRWLERLWEAYQADEMPYIEQLGDYWGDLCASKELAAGWAEQLIGITRLALSPDQSVRGLFCGNPA